MAATFTGRPLVEVDGLRLELRDELAAHALVGQVEVQRRHRDVARADGGDVARLVDLVLLRGVADPVVGAAARILALDDVTTEAARAGVGDPHTADRGRHDVGEVDVDQHVARPVERQHAARNGGAVRRRGAPLHRMVVGVGLAEGDRGDAEQAAFHGARDGAGIGHVVGDVGAAVDSRQDEVGLVALHQVLDREQHAVGRRTVDRDLAFAHLARPDRPRQRQRMAGTALVDLGRHDPDVARQLGRDLDQRLKTRRVDAIVVGDEDACLGEVGDLHFFAGADAAVGAGISSSPPM